MNSFVKRISLVFVFLIYSLSSVFMKKAMLSVFLSKDFFIFIAIAIIFLLTYMILWQQILKRIRLVDAFSGKSMTIIWGMILGYFVFQETITLKMILGSLCILFGVYIMSQDK